MAGGVEECMWRNALPAEDAIPGKRTKKKEKRDAERD